MLVTIWPVKRTRGRRRRLDGEDVVICILRAEEVLKNEVKVGVLLIVCEVDLGEEVET